MRDGSTSHKCDGHLHLQSTDTNTANVAELSEDRFALYVLSASGSSSTSDLLCACEKSTRNTSNNMYQLKRRKRNGVPARTQARPSARSPASVRIYR